MQSTNNNQVFLSEFKELRNELSAMKKRIVQLEESHEKQQERLNILERENQALKTELNINANKSSGLVLKRIDQDQDKDTEEEIESKPPTSTLVSTSKKKTKTKYDDSDDEVVVISRRDNGDSFDSLSDDLLHKIVEFDGNCYSKFGSINKRCNNIYDVKEYKLKKETCVFGYGTVEMVLERYLQKRKEGSRLLTHYIAKAVIIYNRLDVIDWIMQLEDMKLFEMLCNYAACFGRVNILSKVFLKSNLKMLDHVQNGLYMCYNAAHHGKLENLKWLRRFGCLCNAGTFMIARDQGHDEMVQYLRLVGCPEKFEDADESSESEQLGSDDEDNDY